MNHFYGPLNLTELSFCQFISGKLIAIVLFSFDNHRETLAHTHRFSGLYSETYDFLAKFLLLNLICFALVLEYWMSWELFPLNFSCCTLQIFFSFVVFQNRTRTCNLKYVGQCTNMSSNISSLRRKINFKYLCRERHLCLNKSEFKEDQQSDQCSHPVDCIKDVTAI